LSVLWRCRKTLHERYQGQHTAFSFFRDLRYKFWIVYAVSEIVSDAITQISTPTPNTLDEDETDRTIVEIATRIAKLPRYHFKDEAQLDYPEVHITTTDGITQLTLEYPSTNVILPSLFGTFQVATGWIGDGVTRSFGLPYFNP
jgi:hypothetical protein